MSWRLATNNILYVYAVTLYGHDLDGVATANGEVRISRFMAY
jgi:hypothetical protein